MAWSAVPGIWFPFFFAETLCSGELWSVYPLTDGVSACRCIMGAQAPCLFALTCGEQQAIGSRVVAVVAISGFDALLACLPSFDKQNNHFTQ